MRTSTTHEIRDTSLGGLATLFVETTGAVNNDIRIGFQRYDEEKRSISIGVEDVPALISILQAHFDTAERVKRE